jgi:ATP-dependent Clp protease ATP-binding subunit ClpC
MVGAGAASGSLDAANVLKPALSRGEFQCIGATTLDEYRKSIEKDGALERRFQKVMIEPASAADTLLILQNLKERYEEFHHVRYTDEALEACVRLTEQYITTRNFPDKAIDAMDEAGAHAHVRVEHRPAELQETEEKLKEAVSLKEKAIKAEEFEDAALHREEQRKLEQRLQTLRKEWEQQCAAEAPRVVDVAEITQVVAALSGVPVEKAAASESERLLGLKEQLSGAIIGQDEAVRRIVRSIQRNRVGLNDPNRPIGTFLFVGPTGVGKTLLARTLAREVFLNEQNFIRMDMSEYSEAYSVSRLLGSAPGYVGYDEGGQLTEKVRRHPYSVVLFDEIEKANPKIFNVLLQIMDEGHITDASGRKINFKNTIIIMTSNVGTRKLQDFGTGIGFNNHTSEHLQQQAEGVIRKEIQRMFQPEFLNRIDDVILFSYLEQQDIRRIVDIELEKALKRVRNLGYQIHVDDRTRDFLATHGYDHDLGARPLRRAIQKYIEDELCDTLLTLSRDGKSPARYTIQVALPEEAAEQHPQVSFVEQTAE